MQQYFSFLPYLLFQASSKKTALEGLTFYDYHYIPFYYRTWFVVSVILLSIILGVIIYHNRRKKRIKEEPINEKIIHVNSTFRLPSSGLLFKDYFMEDLHERARELYKNIEGAQKGVITAIKSNKDVKFFLYVRLNDGNIIKINQPINVYYSKEDLYPQSLLQPLLEGKEILVDEIV